MNRAPADYPASVEDYLASEVRSPIRREYVGGAAYDRADTDNAHNLVATNVLIALGLRLRGRVCRLYNSDTKVRIRLPFQVRFYYPDAMVTCRPNAQDDAFQDEPAVVVEVVSNETRRIDEGEKCLAYQAIPTLGAYLLVEQDIEQVVVFRRTADGFVREVHEGIAAVVQLPEIGCDLPLAEVYEGVEFG